MFTKINLVNNVFLFIFLVAFFVAGGRNVYADTAPVVSISASPNPVSYNGSSTILGTASDISSCSLAGGPIGTRVWDTSGNFSFPSGTLTSTTAFSVSCTGPGGSATDDVIVSVLSPLTSITLNISANPITVSIGSSSIISWSSTGADSCNVTKDGSLWVANGYFSKFGTAGSGNGQLYNPSGIAIDSSSNIYVMDSYSYLKGVQKFNSSGTYLTKFGAVPTSQLMGVVVDSSGNVYIMDRYNGRIQKFNSSGTYLFQFGSFNFPEGIAIDSSNNIYVIDTGNNRAQKFNSSGGLLLTFGSTGTGDGQFLQSSGIAVDSSGNIYVLDSGNYNNRVQKFNSSGTYLSQFGSKGAGDGQFNHPQKLAIDSLGNIYVSDYYNARVQKFDSSGTYLSQFGSYGTSNGQFRMPYGIAIDSSNNINVVDMANNRVQKFTNNTSGSKSSENINTTTIFTVTCSNFSPYSTTTSMVVNVISNPVPLLSLKIEIPEIKWDSIDATSCDLTKQGSGIISTSSISGIIVDYTLIAGIPFTLDCIGSGGTSSLTATSTLSSVLSICIPTQTQNDGNIYVNRNTKWTISNASGTPSNTVWSGTDILSEITTLGSELDKIYTTVGTKNINAATTITTSPPNVATFTSYCSTTTIMKLDQGTGGEI